MKYLQLAILVVILVLVMTVAVTGSRSVQLGSVESGQEYVSTTTVGMSPVMNVLRLGQTTLGSVVVASSSATAFRIWNATSSTDTASNTVATFSASPANGTYTFDVTLSRGLVVERVAGFNGAFTITWK